MSLHPSNTKVHLVIPRAFLVDVDKAAKACWMSRSDYIRVALMEKMDKKSLTDFEWPVWQPPSQEFMSDDVEDEDGSSDHGLGDEEA